MTNKYNNVLYTGVTSNLQKRLKDHLSGIHEDAFTKRYHITKLLYYEEFDRIESAIVREKQIKAGSRQKKVDLINQLNPGWKNLVDRFIRIQGKS